MNKGKTKTACVRMTGPDVRMDVIGDNYYNPANPLPVRCPHCTFPDIDFVPQPYLLTKGFSSPAETSPARLGNFLVRDRVRRILEVVAPGACAFYTTLERKTKKRTSWWLAVPKQTLATVMPKPKPPVCSQCHEPKVWHCRMGPVWEEMINFDSRGIDVFKPADWHCPSTSEDGFEETNGHRKKSGYPPLPWSHWGIEPPTHVQRWTRAMISRDLYFSVRLEQLFKRARIKGQLVRSAYSDKVKTAPHDEAWIAEKLKVLSEHGLAETPKTTPGKAAGSAQKWFKQFLKRNAGKGLKKFDFAPLEKKHKITLPQDYKDFISIVGPKSFEDIIETEGFTTGVLPPTKLDFKDYRSGRVPDLDKEQSQIDGVMFADTEHGDAFVFDVSTKGPDYPVYWHDHEQNTLEPFAPNFAECVKRFVQKN